MDGATRIVLGLESTDLAQEVMHFLDRTGRSRVVGSASDAAELDRLVRHHEPDLVVAQTHLAETVASTNGSVLLAIDTAESIQSLRAALAAGAHGFYLWPGEREELARAATRAAPTGSNPGEARATVVSVLGARGGVGATSVAVHLAASLARGGRRSVLVDMDSLFADVTVALGVRADPPARTIVDLAPLVDELTERHLDEVLWRHERGFRALLGPHVPSAAPPPSHYLAAIDALRACEDVVVLHLARDWSPTTIAGVEASDRVLLVTCLDLLGLRDARRAMDFLTDVSGADRLDVIINRARRGLVTPADFERVLGKPPAAVIGVDRTAPRLQDQGRLLSPRSGMARALDATAGSILEEHAAAKANVS
jgi:pilus assembly protein CpaE